MADSTHTYPLEQPQRALNGGLPVVLQLPVWPVLNDA